jgi:hypothetical protein
VGGGLGESRCGVPRSKPNCVYCFESREMCVCGGRAGHRQRGGAACFFSGGSRAPLYTGSLWLYTGRERGWRSRRRPSWALLVLLVLGAELSSTYLLGRAAFLPVSAACLRAAPLAPPAHCFSTCLPSLPPATLPACLRAAPLLFPTRRGAMRDAQCAPLRGVNEFLITSKCREDEVGGGAKAAPRLPSPYSRLPFSQAAAAAGAPEKPGTHGGPMHRRGRTPARGSLDRQSQYAVRTRCLWPLGSACLWDPGSHPGQRSP